MTRAEYRIKRLADKRAEYKRNKNKYAAYQKKMYEDKKAEIRSQQKAYYQSTRITRIAMVKRYRMENLDMVKAKDKARYSPSGHRRYHLNHKYGISLERYEEMLKAQDGTCANRACSNDGTEDKRKRPLFVDHCHNSSKVRGLLCNRCNRTLGMFKESAELLRGLATYIEATNAR